MISLKKYLDSPHPGVVPPCEEDAAETLPAAIAAYRSALVEMGSASLDACPALGNGLQQVLCKLEAGLGTVVTSQRVNAAQTLVREELHDWGKRTAGHYQEKTGEVKEILLVMARTAESVGTRDECCARQMNEVTTRLKGVAKLEDLTEIRATIEKSAADLKTSIDRMTAEGKAQIEHLRGELAGFQAKLEEAEHIASCDSLTGLRSRANVEGQLERRIECGATFCVALLDIDGFKRVNDGHGHLAGDELLRQFAGELKSVCRATDLIGRWGGDEFIILLECGISEANAQIDRLRAWVCGSYTIAADGPSIKLKVDASIGLAEARPGDTLKALLGRADAEMYRQKAAAQGRQLAIAR